MAGLAAPAHGQTARVISGEHADFTRLVIELPGQAEWTVGRTSMGYAFATAADIPPAYDLSQVWQRIPKTRLQALRADPDSGALLLTLACPCHVFPFEYRPGMIVLDIKDGAAPAGSAFEAPFAAPADATLPPKAGPAGYDWIDLAMTGPAHGAPDHVVLPLATGSVSLDPLRDELLEQLSRGAAEGVVDMELPGKPPKVPAHDGDTPWASIRIGDLPGIAVNDPEAEAGTLPGHGQTCAPDGALALPDWGADRTALDLLVEARSGLYGEFDALDLEAGLRAVRLHLYLGFGAEAAQYARLLQTESLTEDQRMDVGLYLSMARLVDGEVDAATPFATMLGCDGPAALWAALAHDRFPAGDSPNTDAILRSFLALPPHLRRTLGPSLADKFLAADDPSAARVVRDAVERVPHIPAAEVALLDATADLQAERPAEARDHAEVALQDGDQSLDSLTLLVEAHLRDMTPLSADIATAVAAFSAELGGDRIRTLVLALALSGQPDAAFAALDARMQDKALTSDLWQVMVRLADDNAFLRHAIGDELPEVGPEVARGVAERLVTLGFADASLAWLAASGLRDPLSLRLAATAELSRGDAQAALALLGESVAPEDLALKARALVQLGAFAEARAAYTAAGLTEEAERLQTWGGDWAGLVPPLAEAVAVLDQGPEAPASVELAGLDPSSSGAPPPGGSAPPESEQAGPLARGEALLVESAEARAAIEALLSGVATPTP